MTPASTAIGHTRLRQRRRSGVTLVTKENRCWHRTSPLRIATALVVISPTMEDIENKFNALSDKILIPERQKEVKDLIFRSEELTAREFMDKLIV